MIFSGQRPGAAAAAARQAALALAWTLAAVMCPSAARAETLLAPAGGRPVSVGAHRVICAEESELGGWRVEGQGSLLRPPAAATAARAWVRTAAHPRACADSNRRLELVAVHGPWPALAGAPSRAHVDLGRLEVSGHHLEGAVISWRVGGQKGREICRGVQPPGGEGAHELCVVSLDLRGAQAPASPAAWSITALPAGTPPDDAVFAYDSRGAAVDLGAAGRAIGLEVMLARLVPQDAALEVEGDGGTIALAHPEAVAEVRCEEADCRLSGGEVVVRRPPAGNDSVVLHARLLPHVLWQAVAGAGAEAVTRVPIQRCPLSWASAPPLRNIAGQLAVLRLGGRCRAPNALAFEISGQAVRPQESLRDDNDLLVVVPMARAPGDEVVVSALRGADVVATVRTRSQPLPSIRVRLELPNLGGIDFLPTNRPVRALVPPLSGGGLLLPVAVPGIYDVELDAAGRALLRAAPEASGQVPIRLVYRDRRLPAGLRGLTLAELDDSTDRAIREAHVPVPLVDTDSPIAELICTGGDGRARALRPAVVNKVAFGARDGCRLVLHRARLPAEAGEQKLRVGVSVQALDGQVRTEATVETRLMLRPGTEPRQVFVRGAMAPFDRVVVRVAQEDDDAHYSVRQDESLGLPALQWTVVMGASRWRLAATTAFPTGLFRVSERAHSGILSLNSGVVLRLQSLDGDGRPWPVALELGTLWLGIAGDTTASKIGQAGVVAGLGFGVPIANLGRATQATVSIHAWAEYELSRSFLAGAGTPWGFVFGPSLFIGDVGVNF